jgi:cytochrome P450
VRHPKSLQKLREEIVACLGSRVEVTQSDLDGMEYLHAVIRESECPILKTALLTVPALRLYPPVSLSALTSNRNTTLPTGGGPTFEDPISVPEGTTVTWSLYALHRLPEIYGMDAGLFRPERWIGDMALSPEAMSASFAYLPFSQGRRSCLGRDFALTEAAYTIVRLLQKYPHISLPPDEQPKLVGTERQHMTFTLSCLDGCKVRLA